MNIKQYNGDSEIEIKAVFQPGEKPKKGTYFLENDYEAERRRMAAKMRAE